MTPLRAAWTLLKAFAVLPLFVGMVAVEAIKLLIEPIVDPE